MQNYKEVRDQIRSGDLIAFTHRSWKTWHDIKVQIVRFFTQSEYSHVAIAWVTSGRVFLLEAVMPLTRIYPLSLSGDFYWIEMDSPWKPETEEYAMEHIGYEYSQVEAIEAMFEDIHHDQVNECAAYAIQVAGKDGINLGTKAVPSNVVQTALELGKHLHFIKNS